ncbi:hypothetical protein C8R46DRAFT_1099173 [Mycena filopes]|nr:hypothetical protein C8R46DRAFT_1099173 [Mycena filopes]
MPASTSKDRFHAIGIYKVPPHLSKEEFEHQVETLADKLLLLPSVQRNLVKYEMLVQDNSLDEHVKSLGWAADSHVALVCESETQDHFIEAMRDAEVQALFAEAQGFGLQTGACAFSADVQVIRSGASGPGAGAASHCLGIYKIPRGDLSAAEYDRKFQPWVEHWNAVPAFAGNEIRFENWKKNDVIDEYLPGIGHPHAEPTWILRGTYKEPKTMVELLKESEDDPVIMRLAGEMDLPRAANLAGVKVVTKLDRS